MPESVCVHLPWGRINEYRSYILEEGLNPEIYFSAESLDMIDSGMLRSFSADIFSSGLSCTIHAPFMDLNPGSVDGFVRESTKRRLEQTIDAAAILKPRVVVFHPGYSRLTYGSAVDAWVGNSVDFWSEMIPRLKDTGCKGALENIFEEEPSTLLRVIEGVGDSFLGHCFDSGHFNMFSTVSPQSWFADIGSYIVESHLHDNFGSSDDHLPVGEGEIDFKLVTGLLEQYAPAAIWTLEAHSRERLERSMKNIREFL